MDIEKIKKWIANIEHFEPNLSLGTCKTLGDIKRELNSESLSDVEAKVIVKLADLRKEFEERFLCTVNDDDGYHIFLDQQDSDKVWNWIESKFSE